jgi:Skp family chaperone for outer membrane proteins
MKKLTFVTILTGFIAFTGLTESTQAQQALKVGIVDMKRVFGEYYKTKDSEKSVNDGKEAAKKQLDDRSGRLRELMKKYEESKKLATDPGISEELRAQKAKESEEIESQAKSLEREIQEFRQRREAQLSEQIGRMRKGIVDEILVLVEKFGKEQAYDLVLDKSSMGANGVPFLLFSKDAVDFSDDVVKELNKDAPKEDAKPAEKKDK